MIKCKFPPLSDEQKDKEILYNKLLTSEGLSKYKKDLASKKRTTTLLILKDEQMSSNGNEDLINMHREGIFNMESVLKYFESLPINKK